MNLIEELNNLLTDDIKQYALSLFVDTRVKQSLKTQYFTEPLGYSNVTNFVEFYDKNLIALVKTYNKDAFKVALKMERYTDPNYRLAVWVDYLENG